MPKFSNLVSLAIALAGVAGVEAQSPAPPLASFEAGKVQGIRQGGVAAFLGIPYAAPPMGADRWRAPQPVAVWSGVRAADKFGPSCPQNIMPSLGPWTHEYLPSGATSEDCLSLNVWKPTPKANNLPVLVWIHGGGFTSGSASVPIYDGANLASKGVVVVSINYRVGFLGSFASPDFRDSGGGNFGLQDQIAALRWVQRNISDFGGDPRRVTIAGQSAGAFSVHYLILAQSARGLFHQAILQSGVGLGTGYDLGLDSRDHAETSAGKLLHAAGAKTAAEARKLSVEQLRAAYRKAGAIPGSVSGFRMSPYADGMVLPLDVGAAFKAGRYNDTPVLAGLTADEGSGLVQVYRSTDPVQYQSALQKRYGALASRLAALYPLGKAYPSGDGGSPLPSVIRDTGIAATIAWNAERFRTSRFPLHGYVWTYVEPGPESVRYGAFHTSEVPYVFGTLDKAPERGFGTRDHHVSTLMQGYWLNFVKTGDPNGPGLPKWPAFGPNRDLMELGRRFGIYPRLEAKAEALFVNHVNEGGTFLGS